MNQNDTHLKIGGGKRGRKPAAYKAARTILLDEQDALARVTWLYHHRKLTQAQIAQELGLSRPTIGRLLRQAAATGLVTVSLRLDVLRRLQTSAQLAQRFGLREVFVVPTSGLDAPADITRAVAKTGALYLEAVLQPRQILAVSWGQTMFEVARALSDTPIEGLVVAQSMGGLNSGGTFNPSRVVSLVGEKLHARVYHLYVPAIVASPELRDVLLADPGIGAALDVARQASCFMAGIGKVEPGATVLQTGFLDLATIDRLRARGAVGDISARYFDLLGHPVPGDVEERTVGLSWQDLRRLPNVVAVACGLDKTQAIIGALRTGLLHVLIIDDRTALNVLDCCEREKTGANAPAIPAN